LTLAPEGRAYNGAVRRALLAWFDRHRRDLPWRRNQDPYRIWLSEIMLQQTRVETVLPYYERFLARFPTVDALAAAPLEEALALWSGLGYYRRARQLHRAAQEIAARGGFPETLQGLLALPGIGAYTAAAVGSIAFGLAEPVLDGNVERVLTRLLALPGDPKSRPVRERLLTAARELVDPDRPGDSNQAMMELGATLCSPRQPKCLLCPLENECQAARSGMPENFPTPRPQREVEKHRIAVAVVEDAGGVLLLRRPDDSAVLPGTWELPWVADPIGLTDPAGSEGAAPEAIAAALAARWGGSWTLGPRLARVRHGITFRDFEVGVHRAGLSRLGDVASELREGPEAGWFDRERRARLPLSSLVAKVLQKVGS
jgi:A/G-specific adenine glycosylase